MRSSEPSSWSAANSRSSASRLAEQRREPQDRRADALEQREVRPERERHQRDHDQEEQHAHQRAAADAHGDAHVADEEGGERRHASRLQLGMGGEVEA
jgi:ABC-type nickel/cobalt efflux system permease component RcnA